MVTSRFQAVLHDAHRALLIANAMQEGTENSHLDAEEFMKRVDRVVPLPLGADLTLAVGRRASAFWAARGLKSGKRQEQNHAGPIDDVVVGLLVFLAKRKWSIDELLDEAGCSVLRIAIPSSPLTWQGQLHVLLVEQEAGVRVDAQAVFPGQIFDWGRSKRLLGELHECIAQTCRQLAVTG
jgi:hypothetical protein